MQKRIEWLDVLKGIGIFLVVLGHHSALPPTAFGYIYSFHIPLFFFVSGYLFSPDKYPRFFFDFFKRKARTILVPYFFFFLLIYIYWALVWKGGESYLEPFLAILYGSTHLDISGIFTPLWFLPCLFLTEMFFYLIQKFGERYYFFPVVIFSAVGYGLSLLSPTLPWSVNTAMIALIFYGLGFWLKNNQVKINILKNKKTIIAGLAILFLGFDFLLFKLNGTVDMLHNHYQNFAFFLLAAFGGIFGVGLISYLSRDKTWSGLKVLKYWGQNSLIIFAFHPIGIALATKAISFIQNINPIHLGENASMAIAILYSLFAMLILAPLIFTLRKFFPFVFITHLTHSAFEVG